MKTFIILILCFIAVSTDPLKLHIDSPKVNRTVMECLTNYNINPAVLEINMDDGNLLIDELSGEQRGCVTACVYKGFNWLKDDGSLDLDTLTDGEKPSESAAFIKAIAECRSEVGKYDCKFFYCLEKKQ